MPYCGSRNCTHCYPPGAEERAVLDEVIRDLEAELDRAGFDHGNFWAVWHEDAQHDWFQAIAAAYRAGIALCLDTVRSERRRFDDRD